MPEVYFMTGRAQKRTQQFLQENAPLLLGIICSYVVRMGLVDLVHSDAVQVVALDVFHDAVLEALAHAQRFDQATQPKAWFLAIAANVIKRRKVSAAKRYKREVLVSELAPDAQALNESEFFDAVSGHIAPGPEQEIEASEQVNEMLALVSADDAEILRLGLLHELDAHMLARVLGVNPGTARVRLHRALGRLRVAWRRQQEDEKGDGANE